MKKNIWVILSLWSSITLFSQSLDQNYIESIIYLNEAQTDSIVQVQYFDLAGRPTQTVSGGKNTSNKYLYTHKSYDECGREENVWAPAIGGSIPNLKQETIIQNENKNFYSDNRTYSSNSYDALDRPTFVSTMGEAWKMKGKSSSYRVNIEKEVRLYDISNLSRFSYYKHGSLSCVESSDEDEQKISVFKDLSGQVILERKHFNKGYADTYYVYNDLNQLVYVLPPMYNANPSAANLKLYAFAYTYDEWGRIETKTIPGSVPIHYWYDDADRIVKMQDGVLNQLGKYRVYSYDNLGRVTKQSISNGSKVEYDEIVNYYDADYSGLIGYNSFLQSTASINNFINEAQQSPYGKGLVSVIKQRASNGESLYTAFSYDEKGRVKCKLEIGLDKHVTVDAFEYNFVGDVMKEIFEEYDYVSTHSLSPVYKGEIVNAYYPSTQLLKSSVLTITDVKNGNKKVSNVLSQLKYDDLGNVTDNDRTGDVADMHYEYDRLHGWVKKITTPKYWFEQNLYRESGADEPRYNGSIAAMDWKVQNDYRRRYDYHYDGMNRLTDADFSYFSAGSSNYTASSTQRMLPNSDGKGQDYSVHYSYDLNSNISHIERMGRVSYGSTGANYGVIEDNDVIRNGNQLKAYNPTASVASYYGSFDFENGVNLSAEYVYDENGNLKEDKNKRMTFSYDLLGHPLRVDGTNNRVDYVYSADGRKLRATHTQYTSTSKSVVKTSTKTDYRGRIVANNGSNIRFLFDGGFYTFKNGALDVCHYFIQDYQGNNRILIGSNGQRDQYSHFYPYGGLMGDISTNDSHSYKYGGKELDRDFGIDLFDFEARQYDAKVPGFTSIDPLAEKYYGISPYAYCAGDPVNLVDMHGDSLTIIGEQKEAALEQLQGEVEGSITLYLDNETGRVSYTKKLNVKKLKGNARKLATVINDKNVNVMVSTRPTNNKRDCTSTNYEMAGGAFMGNELSPDGKSAIAYQEVNPLFLGAADAANGTKGTLMLHEVTEAYYGGLNAIEEQKSAGPAITSKENLEYRNAHNMATPQMPISFYYEDPSGTRRSKDRFFQANRKVYYIGSRPFYQVYLFR